MGCGTSFVKYVLFFFNLVVALLGIALIAVGVAVHLNWGVIKDQLNGHIAVAPWVFIIIGAVTFVIAFFGCCGAIRESHCMVVTYAIFLLVIIIVQVVIAVLMFIYADTIRDGMVKTIENLFDNRSRDKVSAEVFANIETQLECCGKNSVADYGVTPPASCCPQRGTLTGGLNTCTVADVFALNTVGCGPRMGALYDKWNKPLAGISIGIACVEVVGALFALCLANSIRNMDRRSRY